MFFEMRSYAVLLTVFNRIELTRKCLVDFEKAVSFIPNASFDIFLTDDGSTDNTKEVISQEFPNITILEGNGNLFWCINNFTTVGRIIIFCGSLVIILCL